MGIKINDNIQIVYDQQHDTYLLVKWKREQIEVGLTKDLKITYVKGPSFVFHWERDKIADLTWAGNGIERVWHKDAETGEWYNELTVFLRDNPFVEITDNVFLIYNKEHIFWTVDVEYDLITQKGTGTFSPNDTSIVKWIGILNPSIKKIKERDFEI